MAFLIGVCIYCFRNKYFPVLHQTQSSVDNNSLSCINNTVVEDLYQQLQENQEATEQLESFYESRLNELRQKIDVYQRSLENEPIQNESTEKTMNLENKLKNLEKNHGLVVQQNSQLKSFIAQTDKKRILDKYGPGPHHVEFLLDFPPNNTPPGSESMFVIEMAPFNLMPHTVYLFLEQVTHGLFNGTSFYRNAGHVVQVCYFTLMYDSN
jgi:TolA-binding protein